MRQYTEAKMWHHGTNWLLDISKRLISAAKWYNFANLISIFDVIFVRSWLFGGRCDKNQASCENRCGTGNGGGGDEFDSNIL